MIALLATLIAASSVDAQADFRAANERALEGDLGGAIALYRTLIDRGVADADVHYNLGNAHALAGEPIEAIVSYERALRLSPGDGDILANLAFVRKTLGAEAEEAQSLTAADALEPIVGRLDPDVFGWIGAAASALAFALLLIRRRTARAPRSLFATALVLFLGAGGSLSIVGAHAVISADPRGVVSETSELSEGPHPKFPKKGPAVRGGRVRVLEEVEGHLRVLQSDGTTGWLPAKVVIRV
jgi:tetratricopeptide (TPR) repeat protein